VHNIRTIQNAGGKGDPLLEEGDRVLIKKIWFKVTD